MSAILLDLKPGDEVIMPSFTFVSTANAFIIRGAKIIFVDSRSDHPGMDEEKIESLITKKTKAIVIVHYAGVAATRIKYYRLRKKITFTLSRMRLSVLIVSSKENPRFIGRFGML